MLNNIRTQLDDGILEITFARPEKRNALTKPMYSAAAEALEVAERSDDVRVIVFTADGRDFCAGNDLGDFTAGEYSLDAGSPWRRFLDGIAGAKKPMVAAVQGNAVGIGMTMLLHCDLVYVEPTAKLAAPFGLLGVVPEAGSSGLLPLLIGHRRALEVFLLGRTIDATEAERLGIANAVARDNCARTTALASARILADMSAPSVLKTKALMRKGINEISARVEAECTAFMECLSTSEAQAALKLMTQKTK